MSVVVMKFGGTSVADADKIRAAARRAIRTQKQGHQVVNIRSRFTQCPDDIAFTTCKNPGAQYLKVRQFKSIHYRKKFRPVSGEEADASSDSAPNPASNASRPAITANGNSWSAPTSTTGRTQPPDSMSIENSYSRKPCPRRHRHSLLSCQRRFQQQHLCRPPPHDLTRDRASCASVSKHPSGV